MKYFNVMNVISAGMVPIVGSGLASLLRQKQIRDREQLLRDCGATENQLCDFKRWYKLGMIEQFMTEPHLVEDKK